MMHINIINELKESEEIWFWVSIISLLTLAFAEVMARRAVSKKEEFIETHTNQLNDTRVQRSIRRLNTSDELWFWVSIFSLVFLGLSEVISHHFASNKEEIVTASELESSDQNNTRINELKSTVENSQARILELKNEIIKSEHELADIRLQITKEKENMKQINSRKTH
jgi:uncharacterized protein YlxW (UPF0749 family)